VWSGGSVGHSLLAGSLVTDAGAEKAHTRWAMLGWGSPTDRGRVRWREGDL